MRTSYKEKEQEIGTERKNVTFEEPDQDRGEVDNTSGKSEVDTYSEGNSNTGSEMSELAIHTLLVETRARELDGEVYQEPDSDRYLVPSGKVFDKAADDLEMIAVSKGSMSLLPQKEAVRTDLQPF